MVMKTVARDLREQSKAEAAASCVAGVIALCLTCIVWYETAARIAEATQQALVASARNSRNLANITAANLDELFKHWQERSNAVQDHLQQHGAAALAGVDDAAILRSALFDAHGRLLYSSANRDADPELASVARAAQNLADDAEPWIDASSREDIAGRLRLPIASVLRHGAQPIGVRAGFIDLGHFLRLFQHVDLDRAGVVVADRLGVPIFEIHAGMLFGRHGAGGGRPANSEVQEFEGSCTWNQATCVGYVTPLSSVPWTVAIMRERDAVLADVAAHARSQYAQALLISALLAACAYVTILFIRRQAALRHKLQAEQSRTKELVAELDAQRMHAVKLASEDYVTGIANRMKFIELAAVELARGKRSRATIALYFIDLDRFKPVNDTLGHHVGDALLQAVAQRIKGSLRTYDLVGRFGGDEFVVMVADLEDEQHAARIGDKLVGAVSAPYENILGHAVEVSGSVGIALYPRDGDNVQAMLAHADAAMYVAKHAGRGQYRFFDAALNASAAMDNELVTRFLRALSEDEFCLHYQARVALADYRIVGLEALVRWQHPEHGLLYPNRFIPLAEKHNLIAQLGEWVINAACQQMDEWKAQGFPIVPVAVNVSAKQLARGDFMEHLTRTLTRHGVPFPQFEVEITEASYLENTVAGSNVLTMLNAAGIRIALDDYGTGFSGLSNVKELPITCLKIDRGFIQDIRNDTNDKIIVSSTITLAHNLGLRVVAEGVESREQLVYLKTAGCDEVQGFYFHRPQPPEDIAPLLRQGHILPGETNEAAID